MLYYTIVSFEYCFLIFFFFFLNIEYLRKKFVILNDKLYDEK